MNKYRMWENGPELELPDEYYWDAREKLVIRKDLSWRGSLTEFYAIQLTQ